MDLAAMRRGRERAREARRQEAQQRIEQFEAWVRRERQARERGDLTVLREMPPIPSDADYRLVRGDAA